MKIYRRFQFREHGPRQLLKTGVEEVALLAGAAEGTAATAAVVGVGASEVGALTYGASSLAGAEALGTAAGGAGYAGTGTFSAGGLGAGAGALEVGAAEAGGVASGLTAEQIAAQSAGFPTTEAEISAANASMNGITDPFSFSAGDVWSGVQSAMKLASPVSSIFSGLSALQQADQLKKQAAAARLSGNPWAASGGQALSTQQLMDLLANPGNVASNDPAYKLRIQGAQRATATQGQASGAMAVAGANASTSWYNDRLAQLGQLSGAPGNPVGTAQVGLQGQIAAGDLMSRGLGSIGFGTNQLSGGNATAAMPPQVQQWLKQAGYLGA